jgi:hypothetical protein
MDKAVENLNSLIIQHKDITKVNRKLQKMH